MTVWLRHLLGWVVSAFRSRQDLILEKPRNRVPVILHALAEGVCQTSEAAHSHTHREILPLHVV